MRRRFSPSTARFCVLLLPMSAAIAPAHYRIAGVDLSTRWHGLVADGAVEATSDAATYGVELDGDDFRFFVRGTSARALELSEALDGGSGVAARDDGPFRAQLQLVRTLRPAPAFETAAGPSSCRPPAYEPGSLVAGDLRLQLRPRAAKFGPAAASTGEGATESATSLRASWDCYRATPRPAFDNDGATRPSRADNVSPCDARGHFLLLPTIDDERNWRAQALARADAFDLAALSLSTNATMVVCFNSVGAGASQNHCHCHAWPSLAPYACERAPPLASRRFDTKVFERDGAIATVSTPGAALDVAVLDYGVATVRLRSGDADLLGAGLAAVVGALAERGSPHNVCGLGDAIYVFARSRERCPALPTRLGCSEMMGVFHCASEEELEIAAAPGTMADALAAVSAPREDVWAAVLAALDGHFA